MSQYKTASWLLGLSVPFLLNAARCCRGDGPEKTTKSLNVAVTMGTLRITSSSVELRCEITNSTGQDIWVYDEGPRGHDHDGVRGTNAKVYLDKDGQTLLILRRINPPLHGITSAPRVGTYARVCAGETRPYVFLVALPIPARPRDLQGLGEAIGKGTESLTRVAFQIGYYIREDLEPFPASISPSEHIESQDRIQVHAYQVSPIVRSERAAIVRIEGAYIPFRQWVVLEE